MIPTQVGYITGTLWSSDRGREAAFIYLKHFHACSDVTAANVSAAKLKAVLYKLDRTGETLRMERNETLI